MCFGRTVLVLQHALRQSPEECAHVSAYLELLAGGDDVYNVLRNFVGDQRDIDELRQDDERQEQALHAFRDDEIEHGAKVAPHLLARDNERSARGERRENFLKGNVER